MVSPTSLTVVRNAWMDDTEHVLAMFGTEAASQYLFTLLTNEQAEEFLRAMRGNAFNRDEFCNECGTLLSAGNKICPKCGHDCECT